MTNPATTESQPIARILKNDRLVVCCGPGGVGKTTTAAALGLRAALMGRKVIVLTIDPAKRLANSLGLEALSNEPQRIDLDETLDDALPEEAEGGEFWAMMLDQKQTLDDLVKKHAPDPGAFDRAQQNNIYGLLSSTLHGMQEYMALDKLHDLYTGGYFDLVILDTPPTKNALEFLETPSRARSFFDERVIKWFLPSKRQGFFGKVFDPGSMVLKLLEKIFGKTFVKDLVEFFETLEFLQEALQTRGEMIDYILRDEQTAFFIVTSADPRRMKEALFFHQKLAELQQRAQAFVVNRVIPPFNMDALNTWDDIEIQGTKEQVARLKQQARHTYEKLAARARRDGEAIEQMRKDLGEGYLQRVPLLGKDVHSIQQLVDLSMYLTA